MNAHTLLDPVIMSKAHFNATSSENSVRVNYCKSVITGALAFFSPFTPEPAIATHALALAFEACVSCLKNAPFQSQMAGQLWPLACSIVNEQARHFDHDLLNAPRSKAVVEAWQAAFGDAFDTVSQSLDVRGKMMLSAQAPHWLADEVVKRLIASHQERLSVATTLSKKDSMLAHAARLLPEGLCIFSTGADLPRCLAAMTFPVEIEKSRPDLMMSFKTSLAPPSVIPSLLTTFATPTFWDGPERTSMTTRALQSLGDAPFDVLTAALVHLSAPSASLALIDPSWSARAAGKLSKSNALFIILAVPSRSVKTALSLLNLALPERSTDVFHAGLARLVGIPVAERAEAADILLHWARELAQSSPLALTGSTLRAQTINSAKPLGSNAFELALRAGINNRSWDIPGDCDPLRQIMLLATELGFDPTLADEKNVLTPKEKLLAYKTATARPWIPWVENLELRASVPDAASSAHTTRTPRL